MLRFANWKIAAILLSIIFGALLVVPSLLPPATSAALASHFPSWAPVRPVTLGLDLQGGSHVLLKVDSKDVIKTQLTNLRDDVRRTLSEAKIPISGGIGILPMGVQVHVPDPDAHARAVTKLDGLTAPLGTALLGSSATTYALTQGDNGQILLTMTQAGLQNYVEQAIARSIEVLRKRIDGIGTKEASIQREGLDRIVVEVPGLQDPNELKKLLGSTAKLDFRMVADPGTDPSEYDLLKDKDSGQMIPVLKQVMVRGEDLTDAQQGFDQSGQPVVNFKFNIRGGLRFGEATSQNIGKLFAIVLDKDVISAPRIDSAITGGGGYIFGHFTVAGATQLAVLLRSGALPAKLSIEEERTVGPGLGQDSINAGKKAAYLGTALVVAFMLVSYGLFGVFANIALGVHVTLIFALMVLLGSTLTLPGIAGIVLTIGMAVDSNVLIYERIREEFKMGRSIISALDAGFNRAFATIVDSNATMLIAAVILFLLGSGPVKGFAVTLALGILTTIFTAVTMTRLMIAMWYRFQRPTALPI
ncbi:MAG: protein translocase subunit SecD [Hyphomicrobiales bacterium]|nr:protein translocase subunit SecD [Hyphomicrobiales bacterium]MDE2114847.1 protein translocase subunit SecD [Hyphomicrobiales bacterium]